MEQIKLVYETRCRRCGTIHEWAFGKSYEPFNEETWKPLHFWVSEHLNVPSVNNCNVIQDYVSYTGKGG